MQTALVVLSLLSTAVTILALRALATLIGREDRLNKLVAELATLAGFYEATLRAVGVDTAHLQNVLEENNADLVSPFVPAAPVAPAPEAPKEGGE